MHAGLLFNAAMRSSNGNLGGQRVRQMSSMEGGTATMAFILPLATLAPSARAQISGNLKRNDDFVYS